MKTTKIIMLSVVCVVFFSSDVLGQQTSTSEAQKAKDLKTYVIEREIPNAEKLTADELKNISKKSCDVLDEMGGSKIQWIHSYVAEDKVFCVYKSTDKETIKEHAEKGGFPVNSIRELKTIINQKTAVD